MQISREEKVLSIFFLYLYIYINLWLIFDLYFLNCHILLIQRLILSYYFNVQKHKTVFGIILLFIYVLYNHVYSLYFAGSLRRMNLYTAFKRRKHRLEQKLLSVLKLAKSQKRCHRANEYQKMSALGMVTLFSFLAYQWMLLK